MQSFLACETTVASPDSTLHSACNTSCYLLDNYHASPFIQKDAIKFRDAQLIFITPNAWKPIKPQLPRCFHQRKHRCSLKNKTPCSRQLQVRVGSLGEKMSLATLPSCTGEPLEVVSWGGVPLKPTGNGSTSE